MFRLLLPIVAVLFIYQNSNAQEAHQYFADHQIPEILKEYITPDISPDMERKILAGSSENSLRVGVIDSGFDCHPAICDRYDWNIVDGRLIGYGRDFYSQDNYPYHIEVRADIFAFGAEDVNQLGQIVKPMDNPISHFNEINISFMNSLVEKIQADPELSQTMYSRINTDNMTVIGALNLFEGINKNAASASKTMRRLQTDEAYASRALIAKWRMNEKTGLPRFGDFKLEEVAPTLAATDKFLAIVNEEITRIQEDFGFISKMYNMQKFMSINRKIDLKDRKTIQGSLDMMQAKWFESSFGYRQVDPMWTTLDNLAKFMDAKDIRAIFDSSKAEELRNPNLIKKAILNNAYKRSLDAYEAGLEKLLDEEVAREPAVNLIITLRNFRAKKARLIRLFESRNTVEFLIDPLNAKTADGVYEFGRQVFDQFIANDSAFNSHGTHVSATILAQDEGLVVTPAKVGLGRRTNSHLYNEAYAKEYMREIQKWLDDEIVLDAFYREYRSVLGELPLLKNKTDRLEAMKPILKELMGSLKASAYGDLAYYRQSQEITDAIKYMGENKIKVANLSLGGFSPRPTKGRRPDIVNMLSTVRSEFNKYSRAVAVKKHAPNTLFFIAAGNDGSWTDNFSRSVSPTDLSSPFLYKSEEKYGRKAINNSIENVITVGAISIKEGIEKQSLAPFTNIPLAYNRPFVLSEGEQVESAVSQSDYRSPLRSRKKLMQSVSFSAENMKVIGIKGELKELNKLVGSSRLAMIRSMVLESTITDAKWNGTSMATPNAAGYAAKLIREKMIKLGLTEKQIYDHADFSPARLINQIMYGLDEVYGDDLIIKNTPKVTDDDIEDYKRVPKKSFAEQGKSNKSCSKLLTSFMELI